MATGLSLYLHPYTPHFYLDHPRQWLQDCHYTSTPTPPTFTLTTPGSGYRIVTIPPPLHPPLLPCPPQAVATGLSLYLHPYTPHFYLAHPRQWLQDCHYTSTPTPPTFTLPTPGSGYRIVTIPPPLHPPLLPCPPQAVATGLSLYLHPYTPHFYLAHPRQWRQDCHYTSTPTPPTFTLPTPGSGDRIVTIPPPLHPPLLPCPPQAVATGLSLYLHPYTPHFYLAHPRQWLQD